MLHLGWAQNDNSDHLTRNLQGKGVAADTDKVEGHTLHRHPLTGRPHGENALHPHGSILLPLDLHCGGLEGDRQLQPWGAFIAPASSKHMQSDTEPIESRY